MDDATAILRHLEWTGRGADGAPCCPICLALPSHGHESGCQLAGCLAAARVPLWRHMKRGTFYREIGLGRLQTSGASLRDQDLMMIYRAEADGVIGVRALLEFSDGRFQPVDR